MRPQRIFWLIGALLLALLAGQGVALAGGLVVSLEEQPTGVVAGKSFTVAFVVRSMHDGSALTELRPQVVATLRRAAENAPAQVAARNDSGVAADVGAALGKEERLTFNAYPDGGPGRYVATVTLPTAGEWAWKVAPFGEQEQGYPSSLLAPLTVLSPQAAAAQAEALAAPAPISSLWLPLVAAVVLAAAALLLLARRRIVVRP